MSAGEFLIIVVVILVAIEIFFAVKVMGVDKKAQEAERNNYNERIGSLNLARAELQLKIDKLHEEAHILQTEIQTVRIENTKLSMENKQLTENNAGLTKVVKEYTEWRKKLDEEGSESRKNKKKEERA